MHNVKTAFSVPACSLWPYKFVSQLLARLVERQAVNLQTETIVQSVSMDDDGFNILHTSRGTLRAMKLAFATNGYTSGSLPEYQGIIVPYRGTASHIVPKSPISPHLSHTYNIRYRPDRIDYLNPRPDGGIVVGGAKWTFAEDRRKWYNNWDDATLLPEARQHFESLMQNHFKGWEGSGARVDYVWTGVMGLTPDERPHIGRVPDSKNRYIMAGFNGGGMSMIFLSAQGLAKMIRDDAPYEKSGLPRLFETTKARLEVSLPLE
jgi:glycine/D-amino acid oxidase-like deaminating enzyme